MPNWCFNSLILSGDAEKIEQVRCLYRGKTFVVRSITYHPVNDPGEICTSLVSTDELNSILYDDTQSNNREIQSAATKLDEKIAFFVSEEEIKNTTADFVKKCLNNDFKDFVFTDVL